MLKKIFHLLLVACMLQLPQVILAQNQQVIPLWIKGAPGFESRRNEPELAKDYWVKNVHNPSLTVFLPPKEKVTGAAVVICPGGGHRLLVYTAEGVQPAKFLNDLGIAAFVLKYRLARDSASPYDLKIHPREDALRAIRLVRSRAAEWGIDTARIGLLGFSAGGEVVGTVAFQSGAGNPKAADVIDRMNGRPNYTMFIYPGPLAVPDNVPADSPPAFLLAANDDACCSEPVVTMLEMYRKAKVPVEGHLYTKGDHGFNMGNRSKLKSINTWPQRLADWLYDNKFIAPAK